MNYILDNLPALIILAFVMVVVVLLLRLTLGFAWSGVVTVCDYVIVLGQRWLDLKRQHADLSFVTLRPGEIRIARRDLAEMDRPQFQLAFAHVATMQAPANVPHTIHIGYAGGTGAEPAQLMAPPLAQLVPSFSQLFQQGIISPDRLLCGYQDNQPYFGTLKDVFSTLIIAKAGGGKTTLERYLVAQACMMGAQVGIIDPHGHTSDGLVSALQPLSAYQLFEPAIDDKPIEQAMHYFLHLMAERINTPNPPQEWPIRILAVDEINMLIDDFGKDFATDLARIAERGRKVGMFVFAAGQSAEMGRTGGDASLRKAFVGRYVLRADKDAVQRLIPDRRLLDTVPLLQPGQAIFVPTRAEPVPLAIPNTTEADLRICFPSQVVEPVPSPVIDAVPVSVPAMTWQVAPESATPQAGRVKQLLKSGKSYTEIIAEVWGITQKGRAWQEASNELRQIVCSLIPD